MAKQYGLIIPNKDKKQTIQPVSSVRPSIFDSDSDSDAPTISKPTGLQKTVKKQHKITQSKAVEEDPTVYQYDEIYDEMDQKRKESKLSRKDLDRKPKYINKLLAAADRRKKENERRIERQVQKEREEEGEEFRDKESFVTSAYKKKLEEMKILEEQEKREEYLENIADVRKQGNLDGFYRHLYDQKVLYEDKADSDVEVKQEPKDSSDSDSNKRKADDISDDDKQKIKSEDDEKKIKPKGGIKKRKYRTRDDSENKDSEPEEVEIKKEHLPSNLDADSDFSIDSSDSEDEDAKKDEKEKKQEENQPKPEEKGNVLSDNAAIAKKNEQKEESKDKKEDEIEEEVKPKKPKIDIWKKRTVGEVFDAAVKRYFERKATREAADRG